MLTAGSLIAILQKYEENATLDRLWKDGAREPLKQIFDYVKSQGVGGGEGRKRGAGDSGKKHIRGKRQRIEDKVISAAALPDPSFALSSWSEDPSSFYDVARVPEEEISKSTLQRAYVFATEISEELIIAKIRLRFLHLFFFDVSKALFPGRERVTSIVVGDVAKLLIHSGVENPDEKVLRDWIRCGSVLNDFSQIFGVGCLFFLPEEVAPGQSVPVPLLLPTLISKQMAALMWQYRECGNQAQNP